MLAILLVRLGPWVWFGRVQPFTYDEKEYDKIAVQLAQRGEFAVTPGVLTSIRPPLYPAMVAGVYRLFGVRNYQAVRLLQVVLNAGIAVVVYLLGYALYDARTGWWAAALIGFYPSLWGHDYLLLTEVLFTFLLCLGTLLLLHFFARENWPLLIIGGGLLGLATLTRSALQLYPPLFVLIVLAMMKVPVPRRFVVAAVFTLSFAVVVGPWIARNSRLHGSLASVDSTATRLFKLYGKPRLKAIVGSPVSTQGSRLPGGGSATTIRWAVKRSFLFWQVDRELTGAAASGRLGPIPRQIVVLLALAIGGYYAALAALGLVGAVLRPPPDRIQLVLILSFFVLLVGVHSMILGHSRYHIPLMPFVCLFAARLIVVPPHREERRRLAWALLALLILAVSWVIGLVSVDLPELLEGLGVGREV